MLYLIRPPRLSFFFSKISVAWFPKLGGVCNIFCFILFFLLKFYYKGTEKVCRSSNSWSVERVSETHKFEPVDVNELLIVLVIFVI